MSVREEREARQREQREHHGAGVGTYIFGALALLWIVAQIVTRLF